MFSGGSSKRPAAGCARATLVPQVDKRSAARAATRIMVITQLTEEPPGGTVSPEMPLLLPTRSPSGQAHRIERPSRDALSDGMVNRTLPQGQEARSCGAGATGILPAGAARTRTDGGQTIGACTRRGRVG